MGIVKEVGFGFENLRYIKVVFLPGGKNHRNLRKTAFGFKISINRINLKV